MQGMRVNISGKSCVPMLQLIACNTFAPQIKGNFCGCELSRYITTSLVYTISQCNTFMPKIKGSFGGLHVVCTTLQVYQLQLSWCATTSQWNVVHFPLESIMLQLPLVCCNDTRKPCNTNKLHYHCLYRHTINYEWFELLVFMVRQS